MIVSLCNAIFLYDPPTDRAKIVSHPSSRQESGNYTFSLGACFAEWSNLNGTERKLQLMLDTWQAVVRDGMSAEVLHKALLSIPEYKEMLSPDTIARHSS